MTDQTSAPRQLRITPLGCLLVIVVVIVVVPTLAIWAIRARSVARVQRLIADVSARGQPTTLSELDDYYSLPPNSPNPAPLWLAAVMPLESPEYARSAGDLPIVGTGASGVPFPGDPWPQEDRAQEHLARYALSLEKMHEAAAIGGPGRYPTELEKGLAALLPHLQPLRAGARLLDLEARVRARRGDGKGAAQSIHAIFMAAESLQEEPVLISQLVRQAITGVGCATVEELLPRVEFSDEDLLLLQEALERPNFHDGIQQSLLGEQVMGITAFQNPGSLGNAGEMLGASRFMVLHDQDLALYLVCLRRCHEAAALPWPQAMAEAAAVRDDVESRTTSPAGKFRYGLTGLLTPALDGAMQTGGRSEAGVSVMTTAIAVERYRLRQGRLPQKLEQLVPEFFAAVPADPFDGQPLRYFVRENGFTVYSIGVDGVDNAGEENEQTGKPDIAFMWSASPEK